MKGRLGDLSKLLEDNVISYYWLGFLFADGHFDERRLTLTLSSKDIPHLELFSQFISNQGKINYKEKYAQLSVMHSDVMIHLRDKFGIVNNKTKNPCNLSKITNDDLFFSLMVGFIDGDGWISKQTGRNDCFLGIQIHSSWLPNLKIFNDFIERKTNIKGSNPKINKKGYASWHITNSIILKYLKKKAIELKLPVLNRKWDKINLSTISSQELGKQRIKEVELMLPFMRNKEIAEKLGISSAAISNIVKRNNLRKEK